MNKSDLIYDLCHAVQSGVKYDSDSGGEENQKHLRTGINLAMCDHGALVLLLMEKGLFTEEEYQDSRIKILQIEVEKYEELLSKRFSKKVTLG